MRLRCILILAFVAAENLAQAADSATTETRTVAGYLDTSRTIQTIKGEIVSLDGEWGFYWKQLLTPDDFLADQVAVPTYLQVPNVWNGLSINDEEIDGTGFATYRASVVLPHTDFSPLTIGVYLDDVDDEMGPMGVLPKSHLGTLYDQYDDEGNWAGAMKKEDADKLALQDMVWLKGPAGSVTVHNCCMIHGSLPNQSSKARPLLLQTYAAGSSYPVNGIGANGSIGRYGGQIIGTAAPQTLTVDGRAMRGAPDWSRCGVPTILGSQTKEKLSS